MAGKGVTIDFNANVARFTSSVDKMTNDLAKFQTNADRISKNVNKSFSTLGSGLKGIFGGLGAALSVHELGQMAEVGNMEARLKLATRNSVEFAQAQENVRRIAASTQSSLEETATLYTRISQSLLDVGGTQKQVAATTEAMALALKVSGATTAEANSAMLQFSQIISSGKTEMGEFNAVNEAAPRLIKALADGLGVPIGRLRDLQKEGKLTRDVWVEALGSQLPKLMKEAESMPTTISGAFTALRNETLLAVGEIDKLTGATKRVAEAIGLITKGAEGWKNFITQSEQQEISKRLEAIRFEMDTILAQRKLISNLGFDSSSFRSDALNEFNSEALKLQNNLQKMQTDSDAAQKAAGKAAEEAIALAKKRAKEAENAAGAEKRRAEAQKAAEAAAKKASLDREKIFQHEIDAELKAFNEYHKNRERIAKEAQEALDGLMKEGRNLQLSVDPMARMNAEVERYNELLKVGAINQQTFDLAITKSAADLERATSGNVEKLKFSVDSASEHMNAVLIGFQTNVQRNLGDTLFRSLSGDFDNIGDAWKTMLLRMASDAAAANLSKVIFGEDGTGGSGLLGKGLSLLGSVLGLFGGGGSAAGSFLKSTSGIMNITSGGSFGQAAKGAYFDSGNANFTAFAKGGIVDSPTLFKFASGGSINNGLMGEAGPEAIMPLKRDSQGRLGVSGGGGRSVVITQNINIDSRTDRAEVHALVSRAVRQGNAELVDRLGRQGVI